VPATDAEIKEWVGHWPGAPRRWSRGAVGGLWVRAQPPPGGARAPRLITARGLSTSRATLRAKEKLAKPKHRQYA